MAERFCLRCDWTGEAAGPGCPRCGAPLYRLARPAATTPREGAVPARSPAPSATGTRSPAPGDALDADEVLPTIAPTPSARWPVIVLALILAASGSAYALVRGSPPDPGEAFEPGGNVGPDPATRSLEPTGPASDPTVTAPPASDVCGAGPATQRLPAHADIVPAPAADYRFRRTYGSEVGNAPDLVQAGRDTPAFVFDASIDRTVLSFSGRGGLALTPATGVVYPDQYTIELLFRFDRVYGYRKIVDFKDGSDDSGLYVHEGCLNFFPTSQSPTTAIVLNTYAQVVLTRDSSGHVVGYVDGIKQFAFRDGDGLAEIASETIRFFVDDSETRREYAEGAVTQIRLYDRSLTANEVAALACSVRGVPLATEGCSG